MMSSRRGMAEAISKVAGGVGRLVRSAVALSMPRVELPNRVLVATHHKTGTVWMLQVFRQACCDTRLRFAHGHGLRCSDTCDVYLAYDGRCSWTDSPRPWKGLHLIRDPRDVIVSAAFYHAVSREPWLHAKSADLGGMTYAEKIKSYAALEDRIAFEMEHASRRTIQDMMSWNYSNPRFVEARYETLIADTDLRVFHDIFTELGFPGRAIPTCLRAAYENSLFSGRVPRSRHVRSGRRQQWREHLSPHHRRRFLSLFGDVLIRLGYEHDDSWADESADNGATRR